MMQQALLSEEPVAFELPPNISKRTTYAEVTLALSLLSLHNWIEGLWQVLERRSAALAAVKRLNDLRGDASVSGSETATNSSSSDVTFKQLVEEFAVRNGVIFAPKLGRFHEGKQIYLFGKSSIYVEQGVAFVSNGERWEPISLETLLGRAQ
jgi:hypothetical protein